MNEEITQRLLDLEAKTAANAQWLEAMQTVAQRVLMELHERNVLPLPSLIAGLQSRAAFAQATRRQPPSALLQAQIQILQALADAYAERARNQSPPQDG